MKQNMITLIYTYSFLYQFFLLYITTLYYSNNFLLLHLCVRIINYDA